MIPTVGTALSAILGYLNTIGSFFMPLIAVCPPKVQFGQQNFLNFLFDTLDCDSSISCTTSDQCPGGAPCRCLPPTTQWTSLFWHFDGDYAQDCPGNSGNCLCFWEFPCTEAAPGLNISTYFQYDCSTFGYETDAKIVPWYPGNPYIFGSFGKFWGYIQIWVNSAVEWVRYITRSVVRGYKPYFAMSTFLVFAGIGVGFAIMFGKLLWFFGVVILLFGIAFGSPLLTDYVGNYVIPALERIGSRISITSTITNWLISFLRWPNYSSIDPIGSPNPNELTCFIFNSGTGLMSLGM